MKPSNFKVVQNKNKLQVEFSCNDCADLSQAEIDSGLRIFVSPEYYICGLVQFQMRCDISTLYEGYLGYGDIRKSKRDLSVKFQTFDGNNDGLYRLRFSSNILKLKDKYLLSDDSLWNLVDSSLYVLGSNTDISFEIDVATGPSMFESLSKEVESADFQLRGTDGTVRVHKAVLWAYSPVLRAMLGGEWKECSEGAVQVSGTSKKTLEHLRDYMYLHRLPDSGLEELLPLASAYIMTELMKLCSVKLLLNLNNENHDKYLELAIRYKLKTLLLGIMESVKHNNITPGYSSWV